MAKSMRKKVSTAGKHPLPSPAQLAKLLGWTPNQTPLRYLLRYLPGNGLDTFVAILQASDSEPVRRFVKAYIDMDLKARKTVNLEDLCTACEVTPRELISEFSKDAFDMGADIARAMAGLAQVPIMAASIDMASRPTEAGTRERAMHFQATQFTPTSKGVTVMNNPAFNAGPRARDLKNNPGLPELSDLPDFVSEQRSLAGRVRAELPAAPVTDLVPIGESK